MNKKIQIIIAALLIAAAFLTGTVVAKNKYGGDAKIQSDKEAKTTTAPNPTQPPFIPQKSSQPEVKFFIMSFCPYGNQAEAGLEPVYQLLKDKVTWSPRYIISSITQTTVDQCKSGCPSRIADDNAKTQCQNAIDSKQLTGMDADTCVKTYFPYKTTDECIKAECTTMKVGTYDSLHGQVELNQDIREICAFNLGDLGKWWKFVSLVNDNCSSTNADTCWTKQAQDSGLDTAKISSCEKSQTKTLADKEVAESTKYQASGSPTILINGTLYNGGRAPEDYKKAICSAFENPPKECDTVLGAESAGASGGCE